MRTPFSVEVATEEKKGEKKMKRRQSIDLIVQPKSEALLKRGSDSA